MTRPPPALSGAAAPPDTAALPAVTATPPDTATPPRMATPPGMASSASRCGGSARRGRRAGISWPSAIRRLRGTFTARTNSPRRSACSVRGGITGQRTRSVPGIAGTPGSAVPAGCAEAAAGIPVAGGIAVAGGAGKAGIVGMPGGDHEPAGAPAMPASAATADAGTIRVPVSSASRDARAGSVTRRVSVAPTRPARSAAAVGDVAPISTEKPAAGASRSRAARSSAGTSSPRGIQIRPSPSTPSARRCCASAARSAQARAASSGESAGTRAAERSRITWCRSTGVRTARGLPGGSSRARPHSRLALAPPLPPAACAPLPATTSKPAPAPSAVAARPAAEPSQGTLRPASGPSPAAARPAAAPSVRSGVPVARQAAVSARTRPAVSLGSASSLRSMTISGLRRRSAACTTWRLASVTSRGSSPVISRPPAISAQRSSAMAPVAGHDAEGAAVPGEHGAGADRGARQPAAHRGERARTWRGYRPFVGVQPDEPAEHGGLGRAADERDGELRGQRVPGNAEPRRRMPLVGSRMPGQMPVQRAEDARRPRGEAGQRGARSEREHPGKARARWEQQPPQPPPARLAGRREHNRNDQRHRSEHEVAGHDRHGEHREHLAAPGHAGRNQLTTAPRQRLRLWQHSERHDSMLPINHDPCRYPPACLFHEPARPI